MEPLVYKEATTYAIINKKFAIKYKLLQPLTISSVILLGFLQIHYEIRSVTYMKYMGIVYLGTMYRAQRATKTINETTTVMV